MYQEFFQLKMLPFSLTPNPNFFCQLKGHQEAFTTLQFCIHSGEGFIKIIGEVGSGKTLLCRKLLDSLDDTYVTAYIPNPDLTPVELRKAFARELGLDPVRWQDQHELLTAIYQHLITLHASGKKVVLLIDEAQALSDDSLETVRLLTNLETESTKLLQVVLFGQPELNKRLHDPSFRQLKQRITFSYILPLMSREDLDFYLHHRLSVAGYTQGNLFTKKARNLMYKASEGIPRIVNILSHKALLAAYGKGDKLIDHKLMRLAVQDTEIANIPNKQNMLVLGLGISMIVLILMLVIYLIGSIA
ncbi:MAG: AAA family ATPase [Gammaproteobacteria bacterium RIFCSPHIGHO2_12_FULL_41_20]|nr:MAG: AAA family ATPase [Gammaproteobacteria bacterium RIFCSPHIGHO2_12_FULL_41_20]